jgi:ligand-binding sensor domain-containing protein/signal transduction histidine kinase
MRRPKRIALIAFLCLRAMAWGQPVSKMMDFNIHLWQAEDGLPNNIVQAVAQTSDGYIWVGTWGGLVRFDGEQFHAVDLSAESSQPSVSCLLGSADGSLWVGTEAAGVYCLNKGKQKRVEFLSTNAPPEVQEIHQSGDGTIWFGTTHGIYFLQNGKIQRLLSIKNLQAKFCPDKSGRLWACDGNLKRIDQREATNLPVIAAKVPKSSRFVYCDTNDVFWIGTDYGVDNSLIQVEDGKVTTYPREAGPPGVVSTIFKDSWDNLWIGSYAGLSRFVDGGFVNLKLSEGTPCRIYCVYEDQERDIWVGSEEGLTRLTPKRFKTISKAEGLSGNTVVSISPSRDGGVWVGLWGGGINHYLDGEISCLNKTNGLKYNYVMGATEARDGSLWAGADYSGPLQHISNGVVSIYGRDKGFINNGAVEVLFKDKNGLLWIGTRNGLQTWDGKKFARFTTRDGLSNNHINVICQGAGNGMWIGTDSGLTRWHDGKFENLGNTNPRLKVLVLSLYQDTDDTLWIGTKRDGLLRWRDGKLQEFNRKSGLYDDAIYSILEDNHTNFWMNSSRGIFRINKRQVEVVGNDGEKVITSVAYGRADGILASGQYRNNTQPAACKDIRGRLWFRSTEGMVMVDPELMPINQRPPPVVIEEINDNHVNLGPGKSPQDFSGSFVIPPGQGNLEIHYAALSYTASGKNIYRYKLDRVDADWVNADNSRVAKYNNLRPGKYRFQVVACNNDGVWNESGQVLTLIFKPHFWQTWWFAALCGGSVLAIVGGSVRYVTQRRLQRKLIQLEQRHAVERERSRIARDVHDELGSKLTEISFQGSIAQRNMNDVSETRRQIEQMSASAREAVSSLQEIIWAADPESDTLEGLVGHISHFAAEFFRVSEVNGDVFTPPHFPDQKIPAVMRHNLYLAVKEAINNSAKHAQATRILIRIVTHESSLEVLISDNGNGFMTASGHEMNGKMKRTRHGLVNMRERLRAIGGQCEISSEPSQGTTVRFVMPLQGSMFI